MEFPKHHGELGAKIRVPWSSPTAITSQTEKHCHGDPPLQISQVPQHRCCEYPNRFPINQQPPQEGSYPQNLLPHMFLKLFRCFLLSFLISLPLVQLSSSHSPCSVRGNLWPSSSWVCHALSSQQIQQTGCAGIQLFGTDTLQPPSDK